MSEYDKVQVSEWLRDGIAAAKSGQRDQARELFMRVIEVDERNEQAWLWLSGVVDTDEDRLICLENVLTLNPENVRARAGLRWLQQRGVGVERAAEEALEGSASAVEDLPRTDEATWNGQQLSVQVPHAQSDRIREPLDAPAREFLTSPEPDLFMTPDGCVYCGLAVEVSDTRCPHCGGRLAIKQFKREERSTIGYLLHAYWILLAGINLADFFLIGYVWMNIDTIPSVIQDALPFFVGPVVTGDATVRAFIEPEQLVQVVRFTLLGLAILGGLDAVGLFLRRSLAHLLGLALIALHLVVGLALFALGFLGYVMVAFRGLLTVMLTVFMFNTIEDFAKEERREWLEPDRHLLNDADYYTRGRAYEKRGMWAKALLHWQRATAMRPGRDTYYAAMARAYAHLGRYEEALAQMDEALQASRKPEEWQPLRDIIVEAQHRAATYAETGGAAPDSVG
jgi:tetratricopeptide (TPR) repeat protein